MGKLIFNGVSTEDLGVVIQAPPIYEFPSKRYNVVQIEGKSGDVVIDKKAYNNVSREYRLVSVFRKNTGFIENVREIVDWLTSANGYVRLEDSYEPDYFRLAMFRSGGQLPNLHDRATGINVTFECKPQRYLKSGDEELIDLFSYNEGNWIEIINPTNNIAYPIIKIEQTTQTEPPTITDCIINVRNGNDVYNPDIEMSIHISGNISESYIIDAELEDVYTDTKFINDNASITGEFIKLYPGRNWVSFASYEINGKMTLKPRWWVL